MHAIPASHSVRQYSRCRGVCIRANAPNLSSMHSCGVSFRSTTLEQHLLSDQIRSYGWTRELHWFLKPNPVTAKRVHVGLIDLIQLLLS